MALIRIGFFSEALNMCTSCDVILPQAHSADEPPRTYPVMYLLHNLTKNHSTWQRMTGIERYALRHDLIVVMPDAHLSSYADMLHGGKYFTYIVDELPRIMRGFFPISPRREDTFICGASMGGYGALKIALNRPEQYAAAGSLSSGFTSITDYIARKDDRGVNLLEMTFGETGLAEENADSTARARALAAGDGPRPRIFITCGSEDTTLPENCHEARDFFRAFEGNPFDFVYTEHPGAHDWDYWDRHIEDFITYALDRA